MTCQECGSNAGPEYRPGFCSFACWLADMDRRRAEVLARRKAPRTQPKDGRARLPDDQKGVCQHCGERFQPFKNQRYCTPACSKDAARARHAAKE